MKNSSAAGRKGPVDAANPLPLHRQLSTHLRAQIVNHSLPPGTVLPSEARLQDRYGVSRSVVRQALGALAAEGLIDRGRGRGSTVAPRREHHRLVHRLTGLSTQLAQAGVRVETRVLSLSVQPAQGIAAALGTAEVLALERLRSIDGTPIAVIHTWLPLPLCASLTADELTDASLHAALRRKYGIDIVSGKRQIRAAPADSDLMGLLRMDASAPVLLLEGSSFDTDGRPVEVFSTWHHPDQVVFDIDVIQSPADVDPATPRGAGTSDLLPGGRAWSSSLEPSVGRTNEPAQQNNSAQHSSSARPEKPAPAAEPLWGRAGPLPEDLAARARDLSRDLARLAEELSERDRRKGQ
ncbi:GntR family transcriptional regulator [Arthrobacter zhaoguopingii]|uniref:GntR family transcriptional regulator n=1 Tax=Arthrobacter zhaoguopingii TaxID=2681491 RepID=UPI00135ADD88|nr:GntR family transcriptional regulator [Arthrobacter zhaoguopingii]